MAELRNCPRGLRKSLESMIVNGVAYHHSGLTIDERCILEKGLKMGILFALVATSTLGTEVNLPVKAVIFKEPKIQRGLLKPLDYQQMSGRAGRWGFDKTGEVIIICKNFD